MILDDIRARYPHLGLAVYAMAPGQPVTVETYVDGQIFSFVGDTVDAALTKAFPEMTDIGMPISEPEPEAPAPETNDFD